MITTHSEATPYRTRFTEDGHEAYADASKEKGGGAAGFGPHALLEASLACCINIWLRMVADRRGIPVSNIMAQVRLNRHQPGEAIFEFAVDLQGALTDEQRRELQQQVVTCPVSQTLMKNISFREMEMEDTN